VSAVGRPAAAGRAAVASNAVALMARGAEGRRGGVGGVSARCGHHTHVEAPRDVADRSDDVARCPPLRVALPHVPTPIVVKFAPS
jgi:hypothetical protein